MHTRTAPLSRRGFLVATSAATSAALTSTGAPAGEPKAAPKLALLGGERSVVTPPRRPRRWGDPERERLVAMLQQDSLFYWKGPQTKLALERFRQFYPLKYAHTCSSGTAALHIAVNAIGIGPGDEVITSPITDIGTVIGVIYQQGVPVFADLGASTYNLDPADVERRITPKTKAIIAVHLCGNPCDLDALRSIADRHGLILIEDCCQAWGARSRGRPIGTVGHIACWSLQDTKHITTGDGGVVASNDERFGPILQKCGDKGADRLRGGGFQSFATNYRMSEPQAAILAAQLERLESVAAKRAMLGNLLTEQIRDIPGILPHRVHEGDRCVYWFYFLRFQTAAFRCNRAEFVRALAAEGVECSAGYIKVPLHREPVFQNHAFFAGHWPAREMGLTTMDFTKHQTPEVEAILQNGIRFTIHEGMTEEYIRAAAAAVRKVAQHYAA